MPRRECVRVLLWAGADALAFNGFEALPLDIAAPHGAAWTLLEAELQWRTALQASGESPTAPRSSQGPRLGPETGLRAGRLGVLGEGGALGSGGPGATKALVARNSCAACPLLCGGARRGAPGARGGKQKPSGGRFPRAA